MTEDELKDFVKLEESISKYIGNRVTIFNDYGYVKGILRWEGSFWVITGEDLHLQFDTDDVRSVEENTLYFHSIRRE